MPYCPECRSEYIRSVQKCAHCDAYLVEELPEEPPQATAEGALAYINARTPLIIMVSALEACREVRDLLMDRGVACVIQETAEDAATDVPSVFIRYNVVVAEEEKDQVRALLAGRFEEMLETEGATIDHAEINLDEDQEVTCPACGTTFKPDGDECPDCGLFIGV